MKIFYYCLDTSKQQIYLDIEAYTLKCSIQQTMDTRIFAEFVMFCQNACKYG